jgi:hypothetical protein
MMVTVKLSTILAVMWNSLKSVEISRTTGLYGLKFVKLSFRWMISYLISYNWAVLLQPACVSGPKWKWQLGHQAHRVSWNRDGLQATGRMRTRAVLGRWAGSAGWRERSVLSLSFFSEATMVKFVNFKCSISTQIWTNGIICLESRWVK